MTSDEDIVRRCARIASRSRLPGLTNDDSMQAGRIALWEARRDGKVPADPVHAERYRYRRALGAMLDQVRSDRLWHGQARVYTDAPPITCPGELDERADPCADPVAAFAVRQAVDLFSRRATPQQRDCIDRLARGDTEVEIAAHLGVTFQAVNKVKLCAKRLLDTII